MYLEAPDGASVALVACDLWSVPALLDARVADLLASDPETAHLGSARILLSATHTHHSQAAYSTSHAHTILAAPKRGFDPDMFEFLAHRIAAAIAAAVDDRHPAAARFGTSRASRVFCNRSFVPFRANGQAADDVIAANKLDLEAAPAGPEFPFPDAFFALDPTVRAICIDRPGFASIVLAIMASHTITLPASCELCSPELPGPARSRAEEALAARGVTARVVIFNGAEADVSTAWSGQGRRSTARLARRLGDAIDRAVDDAQRQMVPIGSTIALRSTSVTLANHEFEDAGHVVQRTARYGVPGIAQPGGAEDARAPAYFEGMREGVLASRCCTHDLQGVKGSAIPPRVLRCDPGKNCLLDPWLSRMLAWCLDPPSVVPLQIVSLGSLRLVTVPGEATTMLGFAIRKSVAEAERRVDVSNRVDTSEVMVLGLTDDYASYFTTPAEYDHQHYEGASMLFGPQAGALLVAMARRLASEPATADGEQHTARCSPSLYLRRFDADDISGELDSSWSQVSAALQAEDEDVPLDGLPTFSWDESMSTHEALRAAERVVPDVTVEIKDAAERWTPVPDDEVAVFVRTTECGRVYWVATWLPPRGAAAQPRERRFRVVGADGTALPLQRFVWPTR